MQLDRLVKEYCDYQTALKKLATKTTLKSYVTLIREFVRWIETVGIEQTDPPRSAVAADLSDILFGRFYDGICARVPKKALQVRAACRSWAKYLILKKWISSDFTEGAELPVCSPSERVAPPETDIDKLFAAVETMHFCGEREAQDHKRHVARIALYLLVYAGLRRKEVFDLRVQDIHFDTQQIFVRFGKGNNPGYVTAPAEFWPIMQAYLKQRPAYAGDILLVWSEEMAIGEHGVGRIFQKIQAAASLAEEPITPHTIRHAFAMRGVENGADIKTLQLQLRHKHMATTMKYTVTNRPVTNEKAQAFGRAAPPAPKEATETPPAASLVDPPVAGIPVLPKEETEQPKPAERPLTKKEIVKEHRYRRYVVRDCRP